MVKKEKTLFSKIYKKAKISSPVKLVDSSASTKIRFALIAATLLISTFFFSFDLHDSDENTYFFKTHPGDKWSEQTIIAEFSFPIYKDPGEYKKEIRQAKLETPFVFTQNKMAKQIVTAKLDTLVNSIVYLGNDAPEYLKNNFKNSSVGYLIKLKSEERAASIRLLAQKIRGFYKTTFKNFIIDTNLLFIRNNIVVLYIPPNNEIPLKKEILYDRGRYIEKAKSELLPKLSLNEREFALDIISRDFTPNMEYSDVFTKEAITLAGKNVAETEGYVQKGEIIISKGEIVSKEASLKIESYNKFRYKSNTKKFTFWMILGKFIYVLFVFSIMLVYLVIMRKRIFADNIQVSILCSVLLIVVLIGWISMQIQTPLPIKFFLFLPGLSMLVAIVFDSRTAFYVTVTMALLLAGVRGNDYQTGTSMLIAGMLAAYSVRDIQGRTQLFRSILFIFIGFFVTILAFSFERSYEISKTIFELFVAGLNSAISPLITFALLFVIEKTTSITTDLKLEEYNNLNHPLLVKLSDIAPGSYQHTLSMSVMSEKCAAAINANKLLCRVGSYFHDIGKLTRPEYFAENQINLDNKHDLLSPKKSADAIKSHVIDGLKLAKEFKLPQRITDFIPMHHGTSLIKHFYAKALEQAQGQEVDEAYFRYPGPKPNSKETAIVMICDSAEAISRLTGKNKEEIEKIIESTIQSKFLDGQFDECNVTLKDLQNIKDTCVQHLYGASHQRVEYKKIPDYEIEHGDESDEK